MHKMLARIPYPEDKVKIKAEGPFSKPNQISQYNIFMNSFDWSNVSFDDMTNSFDQHQISQFWESSGDISNHAHSHQSKEIREMQLKMFRLEIYFSLRIITICDLIIVTCV